MGAIPVLDLGKLTHDRAGLTRDFAQAYGETGFAYAVNHPIPAELLARVFDASRRFHDLPLERKMLVSLDKSHRGYIPIDTSTDRTSTLAEVTKPNQSESFMAMREDPVQDADAYLSGPNRWPDLPGFRDVLEAYADAMAGFARDLTAVAFDAAGADGAAALKLFDPPTTWLRLLHYPPMPALAPGDLYGSAPHTDFGALTLLAQDDTGGLQVQTPAGDWIDVPPLPGSFIVNVGDMAHRMSNGRLRATPHRVINRTGRERYSVAFFYDPHVNTTIAPLPGTGPAQFPPLLYADFLRSQLEASYDAHGA